MDARKIQLVGNRSYAITLPKKWVTQHKLKNQDTVSVVPTEHNDLLISTQQGRVEPQQDISLQVTDTKTLAEFIVFCYIKNVNRIRLHFAENGFEVSREAGHILQFLEGYEITSESEHTLEISFLFQEMRVTLPNIIRRMLYLLKLEVNCWKHNDLSAIEETELTIDRLYYLSKRIIFLCSISSLQQKENEVEYEEDLFFLDHLIKRMESISDTLYRYRKDKLSPKDAAALDETIKLLEQALQKKVTMSQLKTQYEVLNNRITPEKNAYPIVRTLEITKDIIDSVMDIEFNRLMHANALRKIE